MHVLVSPVKKVSSWVNPYNINCLNLQEDDCDWWVTEGGQTIIIQTCGFWATANWTPLWYLCHPAKIASPIDPLLEILPWLCSSELTGLMIPTNSLLFRTRTRLEYWRGFSLRAPYSGPQDISVKGPTSRSPEGGKWYLGPLSETANHPGFQPPTMGRYRIGKPSLFCG